MFTMQLFKKEGRLVLMNLYLYESYLLSSPPTKITIFYKYCFTAGDG